MSQSARAAVTKYHRLGGLNNRHLFLTVLEAGKSVTGKGQHGRVLVRALFQVAEGCFLVVPSHGGSAEGERDLAFPLTRALIPQCGLHHHELI